MRIWILGLFVNCCLFCCKSLSITFTRVYPGFWLGTCTGSSLICSLFSVESKQNDTLYSFDSERFWSFSPHSSSDCICLHFHTVSKSCEYFLSLIWCIWYCCWYFCKKCRLYDASSLFFVNILYSWSKRKFDRMT